MDIAQFRTNFPEFTDTGRYPDALITFWSTIAESQVNVCVWKLAAPFGVQLYTAHEITLAAQNQSVAANGGVPGAASGPTQSKAVGGVNVSYDTQQAAEKDAGWWNLTSYGKQFIRLSRMYGAGGIQLGVNPWYARGGWPCP